MTAIWAPGGRWSTRRLRASRLSLSRTSWTLLITITRVDGAACKAAMSRGTTCPMTEIPGVSALKTAASTPRARPTARPIRVNSATGSPSPGPNDTHANVRASRRGPLGQEGALAVPDRGRQQHERMVGPGDEQIDQLWPIDETGTAPGRVKPGFEESVTTIHGRR